VFAPQPYQSTSLALKFANRGFVVIRQNDCEPQAPVSISPDAKAQFLARLREIPDSTSKEQLQRVREVYGDSYVQGLSVN
jgi:hypothetical protein